MGEEIAFENSRISDLEGHVTLTSDQLILHTVMHHSSTSTYKPNLIEIKGTFCGRTDMRTHIRTHRRMDRQLRPALLVRLVDTWDNNCAAD